MTQNEIEYPVEIHTITTDEKIAFESQTEYTPIVNTTYLSKNNESGTNRSICAAFNADKTNMKFVITKRKVPQTITFSYTQGHRGKVRLHQIMQP